jgi:hypothetical protein
MEPSSSSSSSSSEPFGFGFGFNYVPPAPRLPMKLSFSSLAHVIKENDFESFVKKLKNKKRDAVRRRRRVCSNEP